MTQREGSNYGSGKGQTTLPSLWDPGFEVLNPQTNVHKETQLVQLTFQGRMTRGKVIMSHVTTLLRLTGLQIFIKSLIEVRNRKWRKRILSPKCSPLRHCSSFSSFPSPKCSQICRTVFWLLHKKFAYCASYARAKSTFLIRTVKQNIVLEPNRHAGREHSLTRTIYLHN